MSILKRNAPAASDGTGHRKTSHSNSSADQRQRLLKRLEGGPATTLELRRDLDILMPAARVFELRQRGHAIDTYRAYEPTDCGKLHSVARYILRQGADAVATRCEPDSARSVAGEQV